ncbi:MAG: dipicolinate synthase subunit B [Oscillospiraceae bacterium]|nr:dipicolinate synthase subunit B [Oscillospiraceae bacterium]
MPKTKLGLAICGSYCTFDRIMPIAESLSEKYDLTVVMSESAAETDTRFGCAQAVKTRLAEITGKEIICSISDAEPVGPQKLFDVMALAPCTGNTLAKLACGIADSAVTMACKAHLRNGRPIVIAVSTNDALGANAKNIGELLNRKNIFFVPFRQDDPQGKPTSMISDLTLAADAIESALNGLQLQPVILGPK